MTECKEEVLAVDAIAIAKPLFFDLYKHLSITADMDFWQATWQPAAYLPCDACDAEDLCSTHVSTTTTGLAFSTHGTFQCTLCATCADDFRHLCLYIHLRKLTHATLQKLGFL